MHTLGQRFHTTIRVIYLKTMRVISHMLSHVPSPTLESQQPRVTLRRRPYSYWAQLFHRNHVCDILYVISWPDPILESQQPHVTL